MAKVKFEGNEQVTGIIGESDRYNAIPGWEHFTTEVGGDLSLRLGHSSGVRSLDHNTVAIEEPFTLGRFIGVWTRKPQFLHDKALEVWDYFLQDKIMEVSGLSDNNINTMERTTGPTGRTEKFAGGYKENNGTFTIKVPEVKGSPVRKLLRYYMSGISDPVTGIGHMQGNSNLAWSKINYGGDFMFILLGPTMRPDDIEFACMWFNAFPTIDPLAHLNSGTMGETGDAGFAYDLEFAGDYVRGNEVNKLAQIIVEAVGLYKDTAEDVILPKYIYDKYFNADASVLRDEFGADLASRLSRAMTSVNGDIGKAVSSNRASILTKPTVITPEMGSLGGGEPTVEQPQGPQYTTE